LSLKSSEPDICIHNVFSKNTYDAASKKVVGSIERTPFLWSELFGLPLCYMHQVHHHQPQYKPLTPTLVVGTIKYIRFDCCSKYSYRKPINIIIFLL
jgi:hypothetical protein